MLYYTSKQKYVHVYLKTFISNIYDIYVHILIYIFTRKMNAILIIFLIYIRHMNWDHRFRI
jgi:hypothetical protein